MTYKKFNNISEINLFLKERNIICCSTEYKNSNNIMEWKCLICNYIWKSTFGNLQRRKGCLICSGFKLNNKYIDDYIIKKNLKFKRISNYINSSNLIEWKCLICNNIWKASWSNICYNKSGCPKCAGNKSWTNELIDLYLIQSNKKIKRISNYENNHIIMDWKCLLCEEVWKSRWNHIHNNHGCPYCSKLVTENICRILMEKIFETKFKKIRPNWSNSHLDGYSEEKKIAFEYNGKQHYEYNSYFFKTNEEFKKLQLYDNIKIKKCNENNIILIVIPYWVKNEDKEYFIIDKYKELTNINIPYKNINWKSFFSYKEKNFQELKEIVNNIGYKCLSEKYIDNNTKLQFECNKGHIYWTTPHLLKSGYRCPKCPRCKRGKYNIKWSE